MVKVIQVKTNIKIDTKKNMRFIYKIIYQLSNLKDNSSIISYVESYMKRVSSRTVGEKEIIKKKKKKKIPCFIIYYFHVVFVSCIVRRYRGRPDLRAGCDNYRILFWKMASTGHRDRGLRIRNRRLSARAHLRRAGQTIRLEGCVTLPSR